MKNNVVIAFTDGWDFQTVCDEVKKTISWRITSPLDHEFTMSKPMFDRTEFPLTIKEWADSLNVPYLTGRLISIEDKTIFQLDTILNFLMLHLYVITRRSIVYLVQLFQ